MKDNWPYIDLNAKDMVARNDISRCDSTLISIAQQMKNRGESFKDFKKVGYFKLINLDSTKEEIEQIWEGASRL